MSRPLFYKFLLRSTYYSIAMLLVWICLNSFLTGNVWAGMTISKSALTVEYCEFNYVERLFHQPMNTYSNLAYFFFGILICQIAFNDYKNQGLNHLNQLEQFPLLSVLMGVCFIYLSFGSAFFHASLTWVGQRVDMNGTYGISLILVSIGIYHVFYRLELPNKAKNLIAMILLMLIMLFYKIALIVSSSILVPILILLLLVLIFTNYFQFRKDRSLVLAILSFALIIVAIKIRTLDVQKIGCDPDSWYQGHAVWHLLTGLSSFFSYAFFRFTYFR